MRTVALPDKKYFKIGEVADLVGVEPHVLRYWETQFPQVRPHKARSGHRLYRRKDVETLLSIRELLHVQRFTIAGARQALRASTAGRDGAATTPPGMVDETLEEALQALDAEPPLDDASPYGALDADATTPPVSAVSFVEVDVEALSAEGLAVALSRELAERDGPTIEVEVAPNPVPVVAAVPPRPTVSLPPTAAPARAARRRADSTAQLGFGFPASGRAILEGAKADLRALFAVLDREDARDRRAFQAFGAHTS